MITYRGTLDVPRELVRYLSRLLAAERRAVGTRKGTRSLTCREQAIFGLRWFQERGDIPKLGRDHGISQATAYRYLEEIIEVLAAQAPDLRQALEHAQRAGLPHLILDGTVIDTDRVHAKKLSVKGKEIDAWYSGKKHDFGANVQAVLAPDGFPLWVSEASPGSTHDITAARMQVLATLRPFTKHMPVLADSGYEGAGHGILVPTKQPAAGSELDIDTRTRNALLRSLRCLGERGFAILTQRWRVLQHITLSPSRIGKIMKAALVLTHFEHARSH